MEAHGIQNAQGRQPPVELPGLFGFNLPDQDVQTAVDEGKTRVIFFNASNILLSGLDGSGKINVLLNDTALGSLNINKYVQIFLNQGSYEVNLAHRDTIIFETNHIIHVGKKDLYIKIYSKSTSNTCKKVNELPENFSKRYKPIL